MAISQDLRHRIVDLVSSGASRRKAARQFKVSVSSAIRFVKQSEDVGHIEVKKPRKRKSKLDAYQTELIEWITEQPDLTLGELCTRLNENYGLQVSSSTLDDWLRAKQITYKKNSSRQRTGAW